MPTAVADLEGLAQLSWVFAAFLITSSMTVPLFGHLSDIYGRKLFILIGLSLFLFGSVLCGQARSMQQLILFRGFQGIGAGALKPLILTVLADIFPLEQRARLQYLISGAFGAGLIIAPFAAGFLAVHTGWRSIFYMIIFPGLLAAILLWWNMDEQGEQRTRPSVDYWGGFLLMAAIALGLLGLRQIDTIQAWQRPKVLALLGSSGLLLTGFFIVEDRIDSPLVPLELFRNRIIVAASVTGFLTGMTIWSMTSFIPLYAQGILGVSAIGAGVSVTVIMLMWVVSSSIGGLLLLRWGYRVTAVLALTVMLIGSILTSQFSVTTTYYQVLLRVSLVGFAGMALTVCLLSLQNAVGREQRGIITGVSEFTRGLGGAIGVSLTGTVLTGQMNVRVTNLLSTAGSVPSSLLSSPEMLLDPAVRAQLPESTLNALQLILSDALNVAFLVPCIAAGLALISSLWLPGGRATDHAVSREENIL